MHAPLACAVALTALGCIEESSSRTPDSGGQATADDADADAEEEIAPAGEPCDEPGITRCASETNATEICLDGVWRSAECASGKICVNAGGAQCVDSTGDESCRTTLYCFLVCPVLYEDAAAQDACFVDCYRNATQPAQRELSDLIACFDGCRDAEDWFGCVDGRCSQDLADCYFDTTGAIGCARIIECRIACGDDAVCRDRCGEDATVEAQGDYAVLELCTFVFCAGRDDPECEPKMSLPGGVCADYARACVGVAGADR